MLFLALSAVLLVACAALLVRTSLHEIRYRRVLRAGVRVTGEIVDITTRPRYNGGETVTPIVRYSVNGATHRGAVANRTGRVTLGASMELAVDPARPSTPWAVYESNLSPTLVALSVLCLLSVVLVGSALRTV